jgi:hypothetical protein
MSSLFLPTDTREELLADARKKAAAEVQAAEDRRRIVASDVSQQLRWALQTGRPGVWGTDWGRHRVEAEQYTGFHYVAIHALASEASQATVEVYRDESAIPQQIWASWNSRHKGLKRRVPRHNLGSYRKGYGDDTEELEQVDRSHPLVEMLMRPNPKQTGAMFRYEQVMQLRLTGLAMIWNVPNSAGRTVERYVIPTACVDPIAPGSQFPEGGWRVNPDYIPKIVDGQGFYTSGSLGFFMAGQQTLPADQVQIVGYPHPTSKTDFQSPVSATALWTDTANAVDQARKSQMTNAGNPSMLVSIDSDINMSPEEFGAEKQRFLGTYTSPQNNRSVLFLQGAQASVLSHAAKEMDYGTAFGDLRDSQLASHTTHAMAIGAEVPGTYGAMGVAMLVRKYNVLMPVLCMLADHDTTFFAPQFGPGLTVWYEPESFEDPEMASQVLQMTLTAGNILTTNEWRAAASKLGFSFDPLPGPEGDEMAGKKPEPIVQPGMPGQPGQPPVKPGGKKPAATAVRRPAPKPKRHAKHELNGDGERVEAAIARNWDRYLRY